MDDGRYEHNNYSFDPRKKTLTSYYYTTTHLNILFYRQSVIP